MKRKKVKKMKLVIDIPEENYDAIKFGKATPRIVDSLLCSVLDGTPLDDIKAEIEKQIERDFSYAETEEYKVPCHYGTANGLQVALRIIDGIIEADKGVQNEDSD